MNCFHGPNECKNVAVCDTIGACQMTPGARDGRMPRLLSSERELLAHYIRQRDEDRAVILRDAVRDHKTSGPLILLYRQLLFV